jgi:hypothetical protein
MFPKWYQQIYFSSKQKGTRPIFCDKTNNDTFWKDNKSMSPILMFFGPSRVGALPLAAGRNVGGHSTWCYFLFPLSLLWDHCYFSQKGLSYVFEIWTTKAKVSVASRSTLQDFLNSVKTLAWVELEFYI